MGNVIALRAATPHHADFDIRRDYADRFPELAGKIEVATGQIAALPAKEQRLIMDNMARHFQAMENVLVLLYEQNSRLYKPTLESYLTMQLKALVGALAKRNILYLYCQM